MTFAVFLVLPSPGPVRVQVHPLTSFAASLEYFAAFTRPMPADIELLPWGYRSPSRHQFLESTRRQASRSCLCSALNVSHALGGLLLPELCRLVSSCCHVRDSLFRGFLSSQPFWLIASSCPHVVDGSFLHRSCPLCASSCRFAFRASIRPLIRCARRGC